MPAPQTPTTLGFVQAQPFSLSGSGTSIGDVTISLQSFIGIDGNNIVTADLGSFAYGTLEPGNGTQEEAIVFTGVTQNSNGTATLTGVSSLGFKQPYTLTAGVQKTHAGASKFIMSNDAAFYNNFVLYLNSIAGAGAANASLTVKGLVQGATTAQINAGTPTGSTGAILAVTPDQLIASNYKPQATNSQVFNVTGTWTKPANITFVQVICVGAGGGGGSGRSGTGVEAHSGGGGGGGGAATILTILASSLATSIPVTAGVGGTGGAAVGNNTNGINGGNGTLSSFGTWIKAGGGGGGAGGTTAASVGGGGGGILSSASGSTAGTPAVATGTANGLSGQGTFGAIAVAGAGLSGEFGGGSGGNSAASSTQGGAGGSSIYAGAGGGAGGGNADQSTQGIGGTGGTVQAYTSGGGGTGGSVASGNAGLSNIIGGMAYGGSGGGGGGAGLGTPGFTGGTGGLPGGGGGGGGGTENGVTTSGAGGNGGNGQITVIAW